MSRICMTRGTVMEMSTDARALRARAPEGAALEAMAPGAGGINPAAIAACTRRFIAGILDLYACNGNARGQERGLSTPFLPGWRGRRGGELDVDALDELWIAIGEAPDDIREELPFLALVAGRLDLAGDDPRGVGPVHVARRADVHHPRAVLLEGKGAQFLRADGALQGAEEPGARALDDRDPNHGIRPSRAPGTVRAKRETIPARQCPTHRHGPGPPYPDVHGAEAIPHAEHSRREHD